MANTPSKNKKWLFLVLFPLAGILIIVLFVYAVFNTNTGGGYLGTRVSFKPAAMEKGFMVYQETDNSYSVNSVAGDAATQVIQSQVSVKIDRKVVKSGSLDLLVKSAESAAKDIELLVQKAGGYVAQSDVYEVNKTSKYGRITIKVPSKEYANAITEIKKLAIKVDRENSDATDVTEQYIDLESRLVNLKAQEKQYLEIMKKAYSIDDVLAVSSRLGEVRGQIEQIEGQLKYLDRQVEMSSIVISLTEEADVEVFGMRWRPLYVAKQSLRDLVSGLADYTDLMIRFIIRLPIYILWICTLGLIIFAVWKIIRWFFGKIKR